MTLAPLPVLARLRSSTPQFRAQLEELFRFDADDDTEVRRVVRDVLHDIRLRGDAALVELTNRFDQRSARSIADLEIRPDQLAAALHGIDVSVREALQLAAERIRTYHEHQRLASWRYEEPDGTVLGQQVTALDRVGVYVPGGRAAYPSSVLMNVIPAKVAGVAEIVMVVPAPRGELSPSVLAAARIAGVDRVFTVGGAQAIGALAYGTTSIPGVDKIVGPGNIYVATAKAMVFGTVGIDMIAGPSEVLIVADASANPDWIAMDLFAQAEHDEHAQSILVSPDASFLDSVERSMARQLPEMERAGIIAASLAARGALIEVRDLKEAVDVVNLMAPEHLEIVVANAEALLPDIRHAGAIFVGAGSAEALGDYCAGPNHVLPTARTARFSSPLGVQDFQKRSSLIMVSESGAAVLGRTASTLARVEQLTAHARSAEYRVTATPFEPQ